MKSIKKVQIEPGCITCGLCEFIAPDVFEVTDVSRVKQQVHVEEYADSIKEAALGCPVNVIKYEE
jgi:ferredoxin